MTVLSWQLDLEGLAATAGRCERFEAFFDSQSDGIPMTTTRLPADDGSLVYQQTMELAGVQNSIYMAFANVGPKAVFGIVFPTAESDDPGQSDAAANLYRTSSAVRSRASGRADGPVHVAAEKALRSGAPGCSVTRWSRR